MTSSLPFGIVEAAWARSPAAGSWRVAQALARYGEFAEWYEQWIGDTPPLIAAHAGLLPAVAGERVLNVACGQGPDEPPSGPVGGGCRLSGHLGRVLDKARALGPGACRPGGRR